MRLRAYNPLAMPKRKLGTMRNLKNFAIPNTTKTAVDKGLLKGKENKRPGVNKKFLGVILVLTA